MNVIEVSHLTMAFGSTYAVNDISFTVGRSEILAVMGASGCGKTTTLRCIAGLERPTSGSIAIAGETVVSDDSFVPPDRRGIGMVFQSYALWPHMSVFDNIAYGLKMRKMPAAEIRASVARVLDLVELRGMEERFPATLSGGQQQRVALARSAAAEPKIMLLDEPLSNLDAKLREQMRVELRHLIKRLEMTAIHITHDQTEAMAIADRIIYMRDGRIEQVGTPRDLYRRPANRSVAEFVGNASFFEGEMEAGRPVVRIAGRLPVEIGENRTAGPGKVVVAIRPESVELVPAEASGANIYAGRVADATFLGDHSEYVVDIDGIEVKSHSRHDVEIGDAVHLRIAPGGVICLPADG